MTDNTVKVEKEGEEYYLNIESFAKYLDVGKVAFYTIKAKRDGSLIVKFYDSKMKLIKV